MSSALVLAAATTGRAQQSGPALPPLPHAQLKELVKDPSAWRRFVADHPSLPSSAPRAAETPLDWTPLKNLPGGGVKASNPLLLTDGTVIVHVSCTPTWYQLTPNKNGNYQQGAWSRIADMTPAPPQIYAPRFFASAVLPDGRVIVEGGEYNNCNVGPQPPPDVMTNQGNIYDPFTDTWAPVLPPVGWDQIGDASSALLSNGTYLLSDPNNTDLAIFNPADLSWTTEFDGIQFGGNKYDRNDEENWTLLPDGDILTVDAGLVGKCTTHTEGLQPINGSGQLLQWISAGVTIDPLSGCYGSVPDGEAPTKILQPGGMVFAFGSTASLSTQNSPVYTGIYDTATQRWKAGPDMPRVGGIYYTMADAPAAILPNGNVLIAASPSVWTNYTGATGGFPPPTHFFVFDGKTFTQVGDVANSPKLSSFEMNFLVLPTGEILAVETDFSNIEIFPAVCCAKPDWAPVITSLPQRTMVPNGTYKVTGKQLSGLTFGASYGDDEQASTNYPLVRITNNASGHVSYAQTINFTSASVAPGEASSTKFTLPSDIETGPSSLVVVANGIASKPESVTIGAIDASLTLSPSACVELPQDGGKQTYAVSLKNPPPGMTLEYGWSMTYDEWGSTLTVDGETVAGRTEVLGASKSATVTVKAAPQGFSLQLFITAELWYVTPQGLALPVPIGDSGEVVHATAQFDQGPINCKSTNSAEAVPG